MTYNGVDYAYIYNVQGDVIALVDSTGAKVVEYYYDAWGKILSKTGTLATTLGTLNPFRYRGYVYDEETGLYYLRSRYYNPKWERFANADNIVGLSNEIYAHNLFAYCRNNPINFVDYTGHFVLPLVFFPHDISFTQVSDIEIDECFDCGFMINAGFNQGPPNGYQSYRNGHNDLYEIWYDGEGKAIHSRHHSTHGSPKKHRNPHDHDWEDNENGEREQSHVALPPDPKYQSPSQSGDKESGDSSMRRDERIRWWGTGIVLTIIIGLFFPQGAGVVW